MAEEWRPYIIVGYESVTASTAETVTWSTGSSEEVVVNRIRVHSTGAFDVTKIVDQGGIPFTNATTSAVIDSSMLTASTKNRYFEIDLPTEWNLPPNTTITFSVTDTSAATNEIWIVGIGKRRTLP